MNAQTVIMYPANTEQLNALQVFAKALKIKMELPEQTTYNPKFVEKIRESRRQAKEGKVIRVERENIKQYLGL
jgi:hypothetical protein